MAGSWLVAQWQGERGWGSGKHQLSNEIQIDQPAHLVGDEGRGEGDGVLARGDKGMWPTDLRREGECRFFVFMCS